MISMQINFNTGWRIAGDILLHQKLVHFIMILYTAISQRIRGC